MDETEFHERFIAGLGSWAPERADLLARHAWAVAKKNEVMNLTRIVDPEGMATRHALDSLAAVPVLVGTEETPIQQVLDLGTGAGYPGLALAIAVPWLRITLLDSTRKKIDFLAELVAELGLENQVECVWGRFEEWIRPERKEFDMVLARAVGPLMRLLEWSTNRWFGPMLLWKGPRFDEELKEAGPLLKKRRMGLAFDMPYELPGDDAQRRLAVIDWL